MLPSHNCINVYSHPPLSQYHRPLGVWWGLWGIRQDQARFAVWGKLLPLSHQWERQPSWGRARVLFGGGWSSLLEWLRGFIHCSSSFSTQKSSPLHLPSCISTAGRFVPSLIIYPLDSKGPWVDTSTQIKSNPNRCACTERFPILQTSTSGSYPQISFHPGIFGLG